MQPRIHSLLKRALNTRTSQVLNTKTSRLRACLVLLIKPSVCAAPIDAYIHLTWTSTCARTDQDALLLNCPAPCQMLVLCPASKPLLSAAVAAAAWTRPRPAFQSPAPPPPPPRPDPCFAPASCQLPLTAAATTAAACWHYSQGFPLLLLPLLLLCRCPAVSAAADLGPGVPAAAGSHPCCDTRWGAT